MKSVTVTVQDPAGLHARPAGELVKLLKTCQSEVTLSKGDKTAKGNKLLAIMGLGVKQGDTLTFQIEGEDEEQTAEVIQKFTAEKL